MKSSQKNPDRRFVVAPFAHNSVYDNEALALHKNHLLRFIAMGTRRGVSGLPAGVTRLNPAIGLTTYVANRILPPFAAESFRFRLHPWFDHWVKGHMTPGDHIISSYGYANESFKWARERGGKTFLDAGNSHPENFWKILSEEHRRWNCPDLPVARHHYERALKMMENVDFVLAASSFVAKSFLERGFRPGSILPHPRPINLEDFKPAERPRPKDRPLTLINTGALSLRKGSPYLFEAFRLVRKKIPGARLVLRRIITGNIRDVLSKFQDLPVTWLDSMSHHELADHLREADIFILPSLEDGLALTVVEALACGLPVITTPNTGASDLVKPGVNGEIVPIRDPQAIAEAVFKWSEKILAPGWQPRVLVDANLLSFGHFEREFIGQLRALELA
jgi:glycosyltransferase involved in cell wall biosynthesis